MPGRGDFRYYVEECYVDLLEEGTIDKAVDRMPYTLDFDHLCDAVHHEYPEKTKSEIWIALNGRRKQGGCKLKEKTEEERRKLTYTQVRMLHLIAKYPQGLSREEIMAKYGKKISLTSLLGPTYLDDVEEAGERYRHYSLISSGYVVAVQDDPERRRVVYRITPEGRKFLTAM
jgi:DNA-binding MarR family transcriptional regulator